MPPVTSPSASLAAPLCAGRPVRRAPPPPLGRPGREAPAEHNPTHGPLLRAFGLLILLLGSACATDGAPRDGDTGFTPSQLERIERLEARLLDLPEPEDAGALRVRLAFDDAADLDLYVTDPRQETVYFANTPTRSGGRLASDLRCDAPAPRVEVVDFATPLSGRYRIGVDFPERCKESELPRGQRKQGVFVVRVDRPRAREVGPALLRGGVLELGRFEVIVLEFDVESATPAP